MRKNNKMPTGKQPSGARKKSKPAEADSFEAVAKRLGCDEDKARFEAKLGKIARATRMTKQTQP